MDCLACGKRNSIRKYQKSRGNYNKFSIQLMYVCQQLAIGNY